MKEPTDLMQEHYLKCIIHLRAIRHFLDIRAIEMYAELPRGTLSRALRIKVELPFDERRKFLDWYEYKFMKGKAI